MNALLLVAFILVLLAVFGGFAVSGWLFILLIVALVLVVAGAR